MLLIPNLYRQWITVSDNLTFGFSSSNLKLIKVFSYSIPGIVCVLLQIINDNEKTRNYVMFEIK